MEQASGLAATFLAHAKARGALLPDPGAAERLLRQLYETARAQWPSVELSPELFVRHIAERVPEGAPDSPLEAGLGQLSVPELYLACACVHELPAATALFERQYLAKLPAMLGYLKQSAATIDDICQMTRVKILVRTPEGGPRIAEYTGKGALLNWVRVTAVRIALKLLAAEKPAPDGEGDAVVEALPAPGVDAELDLIKRRNHEAFREAVRDAFSALPGEERHLLRLYFVDRLSTPELGGLFRVNQSTISRWLKSARETVYRETKHRLQARLGLSARDFQSFLAVIDSQLDLSISQLFGDADAAKRALNVESGKAGAPGRGTSDAS